MGFGTHERTHDASPRDDRPSIRCNDTSHVRRHEARQAAEPRGASGNAGGRGSLFGMQ